MPVDILDLIRLVIGIIILIIPGYLWSVVLFKKIRWFERIIFGFCSSLLLFSLLFFCMNMAASISINSTLFWIFYLIFSIPIFSYIGFFWYKKGIKKTLIPILKNKTMSILKNRKAWILLAIIIFAGLMMLLPHIRDGYFLPFHVDEWEHWVNTRAVMSTGSTSFIHPYTGSGSLRHPEIGFHLITSSILWASGSNINTVFVFMPFFLGMFLSLTAFCIGQRCMSKFGLYAAFTVAFIPTTCRMMGPSFYVPVGLGLLFVAFSLWLVSREKILGSIILGFTVASTFVMHPPTAFAELLIIFSYSIVLLLKKKIRLSLMTMGVICIPMLLVAFIATRWSYLIDMAVEAFFEGKQFLDLDLPPIWVEFEHLSFLIWGLAAIGIYFSFTKGKTIVRTVSLSIFGFLLIIGLYSKLGYGLPLLYERSFLFLFLMITLLSGYAIFVLSRLIKDFISKMNFIKNPKVKKIFPRFIPYIFLFLIFCLAFPVHMNIPYYQMISEEEYETFVWIDNNIESYNNQTINYDTAAVDPFKASPFCAVSNLYIVSSSMSPLYGYSRSEEVLSFLSNCCQDESFLTEFDVSVVYTTSCCNNSNFTMIHPNVYIYK